MRYRRLVLLCVGAILFIYSTFFSGQPRLASQITSGPLSAGNSSLGFQDILVLSRGTPWRTLGIRAAANYTGLDLRILPQPQIAEELVGAFEKLAPEGYPSPPHGSAIAWMAHLDVIKYVIQHDYDTVLIIEDDMDWDVTIKDQMMTLADNVRYFTDVPEEEPAPYGRDWDVLWIGNCGDWFHEDETVALSWNDSTTIQHDDYRGWSISEVVKLPEGTRNIYRTVGSLCTWAYGVSKPGARKILDLLGTGKGPAYDLQMGFLCGQEELSCISVVPELFHHHRPAKRFGMSSEIDQIESGRKFLTQDEVFAEMGSTQNILNSTRCKALFDSTCQDLSWD